MAEAVVNLVFLVLTFLAMMICVLAPVTAIGFILWNWRPRSMATRESSKPNFRRTENR
jgi:hypothetical protein